MNSIADPGLFADRESQPSWGDWQPTFDIVKKKTKKTRKIAWN